MVTPTTATISGLAGGFVATIVMTLGMLVLGDDSPPPTASLWATYVGDEGPEAYVPQGMVLHFVYGTVAGGVLGTVLAVAPVAVFDSLVAGFVAGVLYGLVLQVVGAVVWLKGVLGMDPDRETILLFTTFHIVYGIVLGAWVGTGLLT